MNRHLHRFLIAVAVAALLAVSQSSFSQSKPKLIVVISVDQLCYNYLEQFRKGFSDDGLFHAIERNGASLTNCYHRHAFTFTGPGHSVMLTGAYPNRTAIIGNGWFDPIWRRDRYCVEDPNEAIVGLPEGEAGKAMSPASLQAETLGDVLKRSTAGRSKVFGVSLKDRAGILLAGRRAGAKWELLRPKDRYILARRDDYEYENDGYGLGRTFPKTLATADDPRFDKQLPVTPIGNQLTLEVALLILDFEELGKDDVPDFLGIGLSSNDYAGHEYGPFSLEVQDMTLRTDQLLGQFVRQLDDRIGRGNWTLALTADHGVAPLPEFLEQLDRVPTIRNPLGDTDLNELHELLEGKIRQRLGDPPEGERFVLEAEVNQVNLNRDPVVLSGKRLKDARMIVKAALLENGAVHAAYTRDEILSARREDGLLLSHFTRAFHPERSGDALFVLSPYTIQSKLAATHGSPWPYDTHVPLLLLGAGIKPGVYSQQCSPAHLGPTLAALLEVESPMHAVEPPLKNLLLPPSGDSSNEARNHRTRASR